ncbi:MAG: formylglycine-generating enzyme family protein [Candidatus Woesebacteria bacterium]|nr:formylglycine-generating enzyme family protein [Candidatus Woesebacteria bacterium]
MVKIPSGEFLMGSTKKEIKKYADKFPDVDKRLLKRECPQHKVFLESYKIGKYPVTNDEFEIFIRSTGYVTLAEKEGFGFVFSPNFSSVKGADWRHPLGSNSEILLKQKHPVVQVSWYDAVAFCNWLSDKTRKKYYLPSEAQWEKAARGKNARIFPWGNNWNSKICNAGYRFKGTTPVGKFSPDSDSPFGCVDMSGNVFEWTSTTIGTTEPWPEKFNYPYKPNDGREDQTVKTRRVGRGGSYSRSEVFCRTSFRFADPPSDRYSAQGFRVMSEE